MGAPHLAGIPAHLLSQRVRLWVDEDGSRGIVMTAEEFFLPQDPDVIDFDAIVDALLAGLTYRDGGGAEVEWSIRMAERVRWNGQAWVPDHEAGCRADIAFGLHAALADARVALRSTAPRDWQTATAIVGMIRRQVANCLPAYIHNLDGRVDILVKNIHSDDLENEAVRLAGWVHPAMLQDAARFAVQPLRGAM